MHSCVVCKFCCDGHPSHKKESLWAWIVCVAASTNLAFTIGLIFSFGVLLPVFISHFKESRENTAWIGSLSFATFLSFAPLASSLINRFSCRAVSISGCLAYALSLAIASFATSLTILYVTFGVLGAGASCAFISGLEMVRKCFDKRKSVALGIASAGQGLGTMVLSQVLQSLMGAVGWRNALRILAGALVFNALLGLLFDSAIRTANPGSSEILAGGEDGQRMPSKRFTLHCSVWRVPQVVVLTFTAIFFTFARPIIYVFLVKYSEDRGMSSNASSRLVLFMGINLVLGRFGGGLLCSIKRLNNWFVLQGVLLINGISTMLLTLAKTYEELVGYSVVFGFCDGAMATVVNILSLTCVDPQRAASAFGYILLSQSVASLAGPPLSGFVVDKLGTYGPAFYMAGGALILASLIPCVLCCVTDRNTEKTRVLITENENKQDTQDLKEPGCAHELGLDDRKPVALDSVMFVSTV